MFLSLTRKQLNRILDQVCSGVPHEVCGLLGGVGGRVEEVFPVPNVFPDPASGFFMEPQTLLNTLLTIEARGWELSAIYHSHPPNQRTDPSPSDVRQAYYPEALHLIIVPYPNGQVASIRAFSIREGQVTEVPIIIRPDAA